jgi:phage baseplate assembly protein W
MLYSDINAITPYTTPQVIDINSVIQSISTIMKTHKTELLFLPEFGVDTENYIFEIIDDVGALLLFQNIVNNITIWDPRVSLNLQLSSVVPNIDNNSYTATIVFNIQGVQGQFQTTQIL